MDYLGPKHSPLAMLLNVALREPDFVVDRIPFYIHQLVADDEFIVVSGTSVLISKNGTWRTMSREQLSQRVKEVLST